MECIQCGECCLCLFLEIDHLDVVREPRLLEHAIETRYLEGYEPESDWDREYMLPTPCPMLGPDNLCTIYQSRPNMCVAFEPGGKQCRVCRGEGSDKEEEHEPQGIEEETN